MDNIKCIGEAKDWKNIYEKAKELLKENKIEGISFISNKYWEICNLDIRCITIINNEKFLEKEFYYNTVEFFSSEKYELFILTKKTYYSHATLILVIVYYE